MVSRGQRETFEQVAMPLMDSVFQFAFSLTRETAGAEDLVQDTYLNAWRSFGHFELGTNCKAWLFRICRNLFIDRYRQKKRRPLHQDAQLREPAVDDLPFDTRSFEKYSIDNEEVFFDLFGDEVNRFVRELPDEFRTAMLLCDLDGLTYEEIAEVLEVPIGTIRSRISRARSFLRDRLEEYARELGYVREPRTGSEG